MLKCFRNQNYLIELERKYLLQVYKRFPVVFIKAKGKYLWDMNNRRYLDFFSGLSVCNLGHNNPYIIKSIKQQLDKLIHTSNLYYLIPQIELSKMLIEKSFGKGKIFFSNSGAEANECAIKIVRKFGSKNGRYEIIVFRNSFHGRTLATLAATGQRKFHDGFSPLPKGFKYATFNDIESVKNLLSRKTCGVIVEPVQGEGGVYPAKSRFLKELRKICNAHNLILVFDEIQCGMGRLGTTFAYQYFNVEPDVITIAKSIAGGLPLGVTIVNEKYSKVFSYGDHGSTFGGNPVSCAAAVAYLKLLDQRILNNVKNVGKYFIEKLLQLKNIYPNIIKEVRGIGLMIGVELNVSAPKIVNECLNKFILINSVQENILRFLPPLIISRQDVDTLIVTLSEILSRL